MLSYDVGIYSNGTESWWLKLVWHQTVLIVIVFVFYTQKTGGPVSHKIIPEKV